MKSYLFLSLACLSQVAFAEKKPNILWIITDDQRADALEYCLHTHFATVL